MPDAEGPIDRTEQPTALVYITRLPGNSVVAGFGHIKAFGFSVPQALRRLAEKLADGDEGGITRGLEKLKRG